MKLNDTDIDNIEHAAIHGLEGSYKKKPFAHPADTLLLVAEIRRLKRGDFTKAEIHNLCHNLHEKNSNCTLAEFQEGCKEFQNKLFGDTQHGPTRIPGVEEETRPATEGS